MDLLDNGHTIKVGEKIVFKDQGGRYNPRFCLVVKITPKFLVFQQVKHDTEKKPITTEYVSSTHLKLFPLWDQKTTDKTFKRKKEYNFNIYDESTDYIENWYD